MWLWRGETGLWEKDPATPFNFRGNLLGVAFDPTNPDRGYAVGQGGVLLGYGKSWTQEPLPPQVAGANFTSIAFAGSEAIVAYRILPDPSRNRYVGGLLVNDGSGWRVDQGAASAQGANVPEVVAGLPDGGAAFAASGSEPADLFERSGPGASWQATTTPLPGGREPGALTLFREGGALRAIASGTALNTYAVESETPAPNGSPPILIKPYPLEASAESGVLRQTGVGWSDEEHELNNARDPAGDTTPGIRRISPIPSRRCWRTQKDPRMGGRRVRRNRTRRTSTPQTSSAIPLMGDPAGKRRRNDPDRSRRRDFRDRRRSAVRSSMR